MGNCCASRKRDEAPCQSGNEDNDNNIGVNDLEKYKEKIQLLIRVIEKSLGKCEEIEKKEAEEYIEEGKKMLFEIEKSVNMFEHAQMTIDVEGLVGKCKEFVDKGAGIKNSIQKIKRSQYSRNELRISLMSHRAIESSKPKINNIQSSNKFVMKKEELIVVFV